MKKIIPILFVILLLTRQSAHSSTLDEVCPEWGTPTSAKLYLWANMWDVYSVPELSLPGIIAIDASRDFWQGYDNPHPFDTPEDETDTLLVLTMQTEYGKRRVYFTGAPSTPETLYAYAFTNITPTADANGNYYGVHPCRVFKVDAELIRSLWYAACGCGGLEV